MSDHPNQINGEPFKTAYQRYGYTQSSLARAIKVPTRQVSKWANGERKMPDSIRRNLRRLFAKGHASR